MSGRLFAYGTLQFAGIFAAVTGLKCHSLGATLEGYRCEGLYGEVYPGIRSDSSGRVSGVLYRGLSRAGLVALDHFEGDEYLRRVVTVLGDDGHRRRAWCYVTAPQWQRRLDGRPWDPARFERLHLTAYLRRLPSGRP